MGVSTHLYDEVDSVAHNAYCELNEDARKISAHQYIQPIPEGNSRTIDCLMHQLLTISSG